MNGDVSGIPDLNFYTAIQNEHCTRSGHDFRFKTPNYNSETCPQIEWEVVVDGKTAENMENGRLIPKLGDLEKLPISIRADLKFFEIIMLVLYTGPMVRTQFIKNLV